MFDSEIHKILRHLEEAIRAFERQGPRLTADEKRLLSVIKGVQSELTLKLGRG